MDSDDKKKIDRLLALAEENNQYIRKVRSSQKTSQMFKAIYWVVIIAFAVGGFYFVQPYLNTLSSVYSTVGGNTTQMQDFVKQFKQQ